MATSSPATVDIAAPHPFAAHGGATRVVGHTRLPSPAVRQFHRALEAAVDLGGLLLMVWLMPFVILAVGSPVALVLWAALALVHRR